MKTSYLGILSLVLCGILAWKFAESGQLKQRISNLEAEVATWKAAKSPAPVEAPKQDKPVAAASTEPQMKAAAEEKTEEPKPEKENATMKAMQAMFADKGTKEMMKTQMKTVVESMAKDLLDLLELDPEQRAKLLELMTDEQAKNQELGIKLFSGTKEEKAALFKEIADNHAASEAAIKEMLKEPGKYEQYQKYQDSAPERMSLTGIKSKLASDGKPLDETQEQNLMNLLYTERKATKWERDYTKQTDMTPEYFTQEALDRQAEQTKELDARVDAKLADVLTPEQITSFQGQRGQQRAMEKMGIEFMKAMFSEIKK